ncbi:amidase [Amycolatopsis sp. YIM 10]|uniref:amidase n=1 Tax=Amycolatopsis sp. YIM 10 TaxID=2653857 RepID=UPI001290704D|nr:amidase [Amycolatopsis sp. YIM 10]QFU93563.1 Acylamidase [Amycolatopsis sp. YIM 10]
MHFDDALSIVTAIRTREVSCREVLDAHLRRIEETNPAVNAIVTLTAERALTEAAKADDRLAAGEQVGPLHGIPMAHKDLVATAGIRTTYGSPIFADHVPVQDDLIIQRLRAAGAITVGKTNTPELGLGSHTFNPVFGATRNPYDLGKSAGGSSGGAAAALAAGMIPLADGSDTGGSLRNPASFCNVVGLRPSPGRVPSWPDKAPWSPLSTKGPMARTVADTALLLSVLAGEDTRSPTSLAGTGAEFTEPLDRELRGLRVAWTPDFGGLVPVEPAVIDALLPATKVFEDLGATVEQACPDLSGADEVFRTRRAWQLELAYGSLLDQHRERMKPDAVWNIEQGRALTGPDLGRAETRQAAIHQGVHEFFETYDVLLAPVSQVVPFDVDLVYPRSVAGVEMTDYLGWMAACSMITVTGCPALSVPAAFTPDGLPVGLQLIGPHRQDRKLLEIGYAFEQAGPITTRPRCAV